MGRKSRKKTVAYQKAVSRDGAPKEAHMSPQITETKLPPGWLVTPRHDPYPRQDERPVVRDERGRVRAVVEQWVPDMAN